jgi:outer membrane protein assembly factor BamB
VFLLKKESLNIKGTGALLLLILVVMSGLIYINSAGAGESKNAFKELRSLELLGQVDASDKNSRISNVDELMIEANGAVIKARNLKGDTLWSKTLLGQVGIMKSASSNLYVMDGTKKLYCISGAGKVIWDKQLDGDINDLIVDKNGDVLVDFRNPGGSRLQIISVKGVDEGGMILHDSAVMAFASGNGENTVSIVDVSSKDLKSRIITLDLKGTIIWSDNVDNQIIPMISYGKNNTLIAIGEKTIYRYEGGSKKPSKLELNKSIYSAGIDKGNVMVLVRSKKGFDAISYDVNFKELGSFEMDKAPKGIIPGRDNYILYYDESLLVYDLKGSAKGQYKSIPNINTVSFSEDGNIVLVSDKLVQKLKYK